METGIHQRASILSKFDGENAYTSNKITKLMEERSQICENDMKVGKLGMSYERKINENETDWAGIPIPMNKKKTYNGARETSREMKDIFGHNIGKDSVPFSSHCGTKCHFEHNINYESKERIEATPFGSTYQSSPGINHGTDQWKTSYQSMENKEVIGDRFETAFGYYKGLKKVPPKFEPSTGVADAINESRKDEYEGKPHLNRGSMMSKLKQYHYGSNSSINTARIGPNAFLAGMGSKIAAYTNQSAYTMAPDMNVDGNRNALSNHSSNSKSRNQTTSIPGYQGYKPRSYGEDKSLQHSNNSQCASTTTRARRPTKDLILENGKNGNRIHGYSGVMKTSLWGR